MSERHETIDSAELVRAHNVLVKESARLRERAEQAERALALVQCCDDEPCSSCVACLQRTVGISDEKITTLRATLARVEGELQEAGHSYRLLERHKVECAERLAIVTAERDGLKAEVEQGIVDSVALVEVSRERDGLRAALRWMDEYVVPPEFPNEGDQQYWEELRAHYAALGRSVNNDPTGGV